MEEIELAKLFTEFAEAQRKADELRDKVKAAMQEVKETREIAGVIAKYKPEGHGTPKYKESAKNAPPEIVAKYSTTTTTTTTTKWKEVCKDAGIEPIPGDVIPATVEISFKE